MSVRRRVACCSIPCCRRFAWDATRSSRRRAHCAPPAGRASPLSHRPIARAAARPSSRIGAAARCAAPACARPPRYRRARAALVYDDAQPSSGAAVQAWRPDRHCPRLRQAGWRGPAPSCWPRPIWWRRCRCIGAGCSRAATTRRSCWRASSCATPSASGLGLRPTCCGARRWTGSQSRAARRRSGASNVRQAFDIHPRWAAAVAGKTVLLIDDVLTTGATVEACARVLQRGGARHVDVLTLARVVRPAL